MKIEISDNFFAIGVKWQSLGCTRIDGTIGYVLVQDHGEYFVFAGWAPGLLEHADIIHIAQNGGSCNYEVAKALFPEHIK